MTGKGSSGRSSVREGRVLASLAVTVALAGACSATGASPSVDPSPVPPPSIAVSCAPPAAAPATPAATASDPEPTATADPAEARWVDAGSMHWARSEPSALRLGDGRVLVVGDVGGKYEPAPEHSRFAELWDPATGAWSRTEPLVKARASFAAVTLPDGGALVAGGINDHWESYSSAYVFDPGTETWTKTGLMQAARAKPAVAVLQDGRVLVAGGTYWAGLNTHQPGGAALAAFDVRLADAGPDAKAYALATAEIFDPATMEWSATGSMRFARWSATAVTLGDGRVLVWGADERAEIYDPVSGRFALTDAWPALEESTLVRLGVPLEVWPGAAEMSVRSGGTLVPLPDGDALLVGAEIWWELPDEGEGRMATTFRFDAERDRWSEVGEPYANACPFGGECATWGVEHPWGAIEIGLPDGRIVSAGGAGPRADTGATGARLLDPARGTWVPLPDMPEARAQAAAVVLADGSVMVVGGYTDGGDGWPVGLAGAFRLVLVQ
jgi:hypothetical protein